MASARSASRSGAAAWVVWCGAVFLVVPHAIFALATPTLAGQASTPALALGSLTDTVTIAGGASPTGTITFNLFSGACSGVPIFTSVKTVTGNGSYTSAAYSPLTDATFYQWQTTYSGDSANNSATTPPVCNGSESVGSPVLPSATIVPSRRSLQRLRDRRNYDAYVLHEQCGPGQRAHHNFHRPVDRLYRS